MAGENHFNAIPPYKVWKCVCRKTHTTKTSVTDVMCPDCGEKMTTVYMNRSPIRGAGRNDSDLDLGLALLMEASKDVEIR